jgi:hypothetical protein
MNEHELTHVTIRDSTGERLTPACTCGWYSPSGSHAPFERHIAAVRLAGGTPRRDQT